MADALRHLDSKGSIDKRVNHVKEIFLIFHAG